MHGCTTLENIFGNIIAVIVVAGLVLGIPAAQEAKDTRYHIHEVGEVLTAHNTGHFLDSLFAVQLDCGIMGDLVEIVMVVDDRAGEGIILQFCLGTERGGGILNGCGRYPP